MTNPSPRYFEALRATQVFHATHKTFSGRFLFRYLDDVKKVITDLGCETLLDYGCGKGRQWNEPIDESGAMLIDVLGVTPTLYDPGLPRYDHEPQGKFDIVVCTQALGGVPIADLPWVVDRLHGFASKAVYVGERLGPCKKDLHAHMADEMPYEWTHEQWAEVIRRPGSAVPCWLRTHSNVDGVSRLDSLNG